MSSTKICLFILSTFVLFKFNKSDCVGYGASCKVGGLKCCAPDSKCQGGACCIGETHLCVSDIYPNKKCCDGLPCNKNDFGQKICGRSCLDRTTDKCDVNNDRCCGGMICSSQTKTCKRICKDRGEGCDVTNNNCCGGMQCSTRLKRCERCQGLFESCFGHEKCCDGLKCNNNMCRRN
ncbi:hypothetical protein ACQ4LE_010469 [Meloidogyne hapla]